MTKAFATLIDVAQRKTDSAAIKVGQLNARCCESDQKHGVLVNYRDEYRARLETAVVRGAPVEEVRNFRAFLAKLDEAVKQQENEVGFWRDQIDSARDQWHGQQRSLSSFNAISARRDALESRAHGHRKQKQQDEFAARAVSGQRFAFGE